MIKSIFFLCTMTLCIPLVAQITFTVDCNKVVSTISPYIYGANSTGSIDGYDTTNIRLENQAQITSRRFGGDRSTPYNWENNISTQGHYGTSSDDENDDYVPSLYGIYNCNGTSYNSPCVPNAANKLFQLNSVKESAYSLLSLPMIGYVANNITAPNATITAPSVNFNKTYYQKPGAPSSWSLNPNLTDGKVFIDEELHELLHFCDSIAKITRPNGYSLDNEPTSWTGTHPHIHPSVVKCDEIINQSIALSTLIKAQQPTAETFGAVHVNFASYLDGNAYPTYTNNWNLYNNIAPNYYQNFNQAFLGEMKRASDSVGKRLLDVLDVHWYPAIQNANNDIDNTLTDSSTRKMRMQAPRELDDTSFRENSWVQDAVLDSGINYFGRLKRDIANRYPGTKLSMSEYRFGGQQDVSGGIAITDVLGRSAKNGLYQAHDFDVMDNYVAAAFKLFRNYDGNNATFGDILVASSDNETKKASAGVTIDGCNDFKYTELYASTESANANRMHLVVLNKSTSNYSTNFSINSPIVFTKYSVYGFNENSNSIVLYQKDVPMSGNTINAYTLPRLSALHFVLTNPNTTLPIEKISLNGYNTDNGTMLNWSLVEGLNINHFVVEYSSDGISFTESGNVTANGKGNYAFLCPSNLTQDAKLIYFRLKTVDDMGNMSYSSVLTMKINVYNQLIKISPNPSRGLIKIEANNNVVGTTAEILNLQGVTAAQVKITNSQTTVNLSSLTKGIYFVKFENGEVKKIIRN